MVETSQPAEQRRTAFSTPILERRLVLNTHQAQQVQHRVLDRAIRSMYAIDVIVRIVGDAKEVDAVNQLIIERVDNAAQEMRAELERVKKLVKDNGVELSHTYSNPLDRAVAISSPQALRYLGLLTQYDELVTHIDALWFGGQFTGKQKSEAIYQYQRLLLKAANYIIQLERRARNTASNKGMTEEVAAAVGETATETVSEETDGDAPAKPEAKPRGRRRAADASPAADPADLAGAVDLDHGAAPTVAVVEKAA